MNGPGCLDNFVVALLFGALPGCNLEATRRIRHNGANGDIPIIAITSNAMAGDMDLVIAAGCTGYFEKPIDPLTIMDKIHTLLGWGESHANGHKEHL